MKQMKISAVTTGFCWANRDPSEPFYLVRGQSASMFAQFPEGGEYSDEVGC